MRDGRPAPPLHDPLERILIVPQAHTAIFATRFQIEMYELFHRSLGGQLGHMIGTPIIVLGMFVGLHGATHSVWPGIALLAAIVALGMRVDAIAASIIGVLGATMLALTVAWADVWAASGTVVGAALVGTGCAVQTLSHLFEDVPPPLSGTTRFVPVREWLRRLDLRNAARSSLLTMGVFFWLELWATPRIWTIQVLHVLMGGGYKPELRAALDRRAQEILADPTCDWRRPQPLESAA